MSDKLLYCSFCGKNQEDKEVKQIIAGDDSNICNNCVELSSEIIVIEKYGYKEGAKKLQAKNKALLESNKELKTALEDLMASIGGSKKLCGYEFCCTCSGDRARALLDKAEV